MWKDLPVEGEMRSEQRLQALWAAYRESCPPPGPSPQFMPELWRRIEARQPWFYGFSRLGPVFASAAAALCLLFGLLAEDPVTAILADSATYVEILEYGPDSDIPEYGRVVLVSAERSGARD